MPPPISGFPNFHYVHRNQVAYRNAIEQRDIPMEILVHRPKIPICWIQSSHCTSKPRSERHPRINSLKKSNLVCPNRRYKSLGSLPHYSQFAEGRSPTIMPSQSQTSTSCCCTDCNTDTCGSECSCGTNCHCESCHCG